MTISLSFCATITTTDFRRSGRRPGAPMTKIFRRAPEREQRYTLDSLAAETDLSPRSIRTYIQLGVIPRGEPVRDPRVGVYTYRHVQALMELKRIRDSNMSLADIRDRLNPVEDL